MPRWNVVQSVNKMMAGTNRGWRGAQRNARYIPVRDAGSASISAPVLTQWIFDYNGNDGREGSTQFFVVPEGITAVTVDCYGAEGGTNATNTGGLGARIVGLVAVTPGETLNVEVGGHPESGDQSFPGYNGGGDAEGQTSSGSAGGGGGASDVRRGSALADRLIVAGGGGGGASAPGNSPSDGGDGGYPDGEAASTPTVGGAGGTQSAGGVAGTGGGIVVAATDGALGVGGDGSKSFASNAGGGGGGGYYGGGGGGWPGGENFADGGGGSSAVLLGTALIAVENGVRSGHGRVIFSA